MSSYLLLASALVVAIVCCGITETSASWKKHGNLCYYFSSVQGSTTAYGARMECHKKGAVLARVESADVNNFIKSVIWSTYQKHWIGILKHNYGGVEQYIYWDSLTPIVYNNWGAGQPMDYTCVFLRRVGSTMVWYTGDCNHIYQYICQKPC